MAETGAPGASLTWRETMVAAQVAGGFTNKEIASHLSISPSTVKNHVSTAMGKLGVTRRVQLAAWWWTTSKADKGG